MPATGGALQGVRVLDLSRVLAGPYCTQMLADHGAEVIKVEPPSGDETRGWGPPFLPSGTSAYYSGLNRNKTNISLDLRTEQGQELLARLLQTCDVLVENFKAGTLARWGLDDEALERDYPALIRCRITGFGVDGPRGGLPGYDAVLQAYGGLMSINGEAEGPPLRVGVPIVDQTTGLLGFSGILLALQERTRSGKGQLVDCTLLDTAVSLLHPHTATWLADGSVPTRTGSAHPTIAPYDNYRTRDGLFFIGVGNDRQFAALVGVLGQPGLAQDPRFATNADRVTHREDLCVVLEDLVGQWDREALADALLQKGVPSTPVHDVGEALTDPQVRHREMIVEQDGYRGVGVPIKLGRTPGTVRTPPRDHGADTRGVLADLGYGEGEIEALLESGVAVAHGDRDASGHRPD